MAPTIIRFLVAPSQIERGQSAHIMWLVHFASSVNITGLGDVHNAGDEIVSPSETTRYILTACDGGNCVSKEIILTVTDPVPPSYGCLLYTSPSPRDGLLSRMPSSA